MDTEAVLGHRYLTRAVDDELHHRLGVAGAVVVDGERPQAVWESADLPQVIGCLARSGFPALCDLDGSDSALAMTGYLEDVTRADVHRLAQIRHAPEVLDHLIRSLARQTAARVRVSTLTADLEQVAPGIRVETVASCLGGRVHHYRDSSGREIDAVLTLPDGRWAAVEVKLGGLQAAAGASSLARAVDQVDTSTQGEPPLRLVVTGTGPVLTMDDGTVTCPLSALRPKMTPKMTPK